MPIYGDPEKVVQEVLARANQEADSLVQRALKIRERRLRAAREESLSPRAEAEAKAKLQANREKQRTVASAGLEAKRRVLSKKEELVERIFSQAIQKLEEIRKSESYRDIISRLIEQAAYALGNKELTVEFDKGDSHIFTQKFQADISNKLSSQLHFKQNDIPGGGVILRSQHAIFDNTFLARLERLKGELREEILEILLG